MTLFEAYSFLMADQCMEALLLPPHQGIAFNAMRNFGGYQPWLMVMVSTVGATLGMSINFLLGRMLRSCQKKDFFPEPSLGFITLHRWLLAVQPLPSLLVSIPTLGAVMAIISGFTGYRWGRFLLCCAISFSLYFSYLCSQPF